MEEIKKAYVHPTLTKVVLTTNERIASPVCAPEGSIPNPDDCEDVSPSMIPGSPS